MLENESNHIRKAKQGEAASFGILYDYYTPQIYRFIYLKTSSKSEAQDLLHEVFLKAWQNIASYDDRGLPFSSWLYQIARNRVIDYYRTKRDHSDITEVDLIAAPEVSLLDNKLSLAKVMEAIKQLNEEHQNIIVMRFVNDLSSETIAAALDKSEGAVRLAQHRALNQLKKILNNSDNTHES